MTPNQQTGASSLASCKRPGRQAGRQLRPATVHAIDFLWCGACMASSGVHFMPFVAMHSRLFESLSKVDSAVNIWKVRVLLPGHVSCSHCHAVPGTTAPPAKMCLLLHVYNSYNDSVLFFFFFKYNLT